MIIAIFAFSEKTQLDFLVRGLHATVLVRMLVKGILQLINVLIY